MDSPLQTSTPNAASDASRRIASTDTPRGINSIDASRRVGSIDSINAIDASRRVVSVSAEDLFNDESDCETASTASYESEDAFRSLQEEPQKRPHHLLLRRRTFAAMENHRRTQRRLYKILVIGEPHCGKSAVIRRYVHDFFSSDYRSTIGVDFQVKILPPPRDDVEVRLQLWDVAGQERFSRGLSRAYFRGANGALVVFDRTRAETFESALSRWKRDLDAQCGLPDGRRVPAVLLANKSDLRRDRNLPDDEDISRRVVEGGFAPKWFDTSALTGDGVHEAVGLLVSYMMAMDTWSEPIQDEVIKLKPNIPEKKKSSPNNACNC